MCTYHVYCIQLQKQLSFVQTVNQRVQQLAGDKEKDDAEEDRDWQRWKCLLVDGKQQQGTCQALWRVVQESTRRTESFRQLKFKRTTKIAM
jgi:hypothetical protein